MDMSEPDGYVRKIYGQVAALGAAGVDMDIMSLSGSSTVILRAGARSCSSARVVGTFRPFIGGNRIALFRCALQYLDANRPSFVYIRYPITDPLLIMFLVQTCRRLPSTIIFFELPTYPYDHIPENHEGVRRRLVMGSDRICRRFLKHLVHRIVGLDCTGPIYGVEVVTIQNGVDVERFPAVRAGRRLESTLHVIGVANLMDYHGFDRVVAGLRRQLVRIDEGRIELHFVGPNTTAMEKMKRKVLEGGLKTSVFFHGAKTGAELDELFDRCHIAVGTLGWHRVNVHQTSNLKSREYMARGIPYVYSGLDVSVPKGFPHVLEVPATDDPVDSDVLWAFARRVYSNPLHSVEMRRYAERKMNWRQVIQPLVSELHRLTVANPHVRATT